MIMYCLARDTPHFRELDIGVWSNGGMVISKEKRKEWITQD
jgi:regulator of RNase E activity RraA